MQPKIFLQECEKPIKQQGNSFQRFQHIGDVFMEIQSSRTKVSHSLWSEPKESKTCEVFGGKPIY